MLHFRLLILAIRRVGLLSCRKPDLPFFCLGYEFSFTLPSLVYPDGRFYVDLDIADLVKYMKSLGIPSSYIESIRKKRGGSRSTFPLTTVQAVPYTDVSNMNIFKTFKAPGALGIRESATLYMKSKEPFEPLSSPVPLHSSPKIQWVINFTGGSDFNECQRRARK